MVAKKAKAQVHPLSLSGEGMRMPLEFLKNEEGQLQVRMEFAQAPAPTHKFVADEFSILTAPGKMRLVFIQMNVVGRPRAVVDIHVQHGAARQFAGIFASFPEVKEPIPQFKLDGEPAESIALWATFARMSVASPVSACVDFYYSSPFALSQSQAEQAFYAMDVVRIQMSEPLILSFAQAMREAVAKLPA